MDEVLDLQLYPSGRFIGFCQGSVLTLLLTLSGMYGVLSYLVTRRAREIGIRVTLGARPAGVAALILRQWLRWR
jgi:hypothetical protein